MIKTLYLLTTVPYSTNFCTFNLKGKRFNLFELRILIFFSKTKKKHKKLDFHQIRTFFGKVIKNVKGRDVKKNSKNTVLHCEFNTFVYKA